MQRRRRCHAIPHPDRARHVRPDRSPGRSALGRANAALAPLFPHFQREDAAGADPGVADRQARGREGERRARRAGRRRRRKRSSLRPTRRSPAATKAEFPLAVWQTGSGTQTNMNVNEVLANRASEILGGIARRRPARPSERRRQPRPVVERRVPDGDERRRGRRDGEAPAARARRAARDARAQGRGIRRTSSRSAARICRTRRRSRWGRSSRATSRSSTTRGAISRRRCRTSTSSRRAAPPSEPGSTRIRSSAARVAAEIAATTGLPFVTAPNKFEAMGAADALVHAARRAQDARGRRCSRSPTTSAGSRAARARDSASSRCPENEPGSSIMPGKVNPTQCEALTMLSRAGDGQRRRGQHRRRVGQFRAQRLSAAHHPQRAAEPAPARRRHDELREHMPCAGSSPIASASRELRRSLADAGDGARAAHRLRQGGRHREEGAPRRARRCARRRSRSGHVSADDFDAWVRPEQMVGRTLSHPILRPRCFRFAARRGSPESRSSGCELALSPPRRSGARAPDSGARARPRLA